MKSKDGSERGGACAQAAKGQAQVARRGKRLVKVTLVAMLGVVLVGGGVAYWLWITEPAYWQRWQRYLDQHTDDELLAMAEGLERDVAEQLRAQRRSTAAQGTPAAQAPTGSARGAAGGSARGATGASAGAARDATGASAGAMRDATSETNPAQSEGEPGEVAQPDQPGADNQDRPSDDAEADDRPWYERLPLVNNDAEAEALGLASPRTGDGGAGTGAAPGGGNSVLDDPPLPRDGNGHGTGGAGGAGSGGTAGGTGGAVGNAGGLPNVDAPADGSPVDLRLTMTQVNAWMDQKLDGWLRSQGKSLPSSVQQPMLATDGDQLVLAFRYQTPTVSQVVSMKFNVKMTSDGQAQVTLAQVQGGSLPLPTNALNSQLKSLSEADATVMKIANSFNGTRFDPVVHLDRDTLRLLGLQVAPDSVDLTVKAE